jgi:hypothetical protein
MNSELRLKEKRQRRGLLILVLILLLIAATGLGALAWFRVYLRGEAFRAQISRDVSEALGISGEFTPLHWDGATVYSDRFEGPGVDAPWLRNVRADHIRATVDLFQLARNRLHLEDLTISRLSVALDFDSFPVTAPARFPEVRFLAAGLTASPSDDAPPPIVGRVEIETLELSWVASGAYTGQWTGASLEGTSDGADWVVSGTGGTIEQEGWPPLALDRLEGRFRDPAFHITVLSLHRSEPPGRLTLQGQIGSEEDPRWADLRGTYADIPVGDFLPEDWRARLHGRIFGSFQFQGAPPTGEFTTEISVRDGRLEALPILDQIALFTGADAFRVLRLHRAEASVFASEDVLEVHGLAAEAPGLLALQGNCEVVDGSILGVLDLGVAPSQLNWLPGAKKRVFHGDRDGYRWTTVKLTGPASHPREDLTQRLVAAAGAEVVEGAQDWLEEGLKQARELLEQLGRE